MNGNQTSLLILKLYQITLATTYVSPSSEKVLNDLKQLVWSIVILIYNMNKPFLWKNNLQNTQLYLSSKV